SAKGRRRSTGSSVPSTSAASPAMSKRPGDLLTRPAPAAAALVGLALLDEAREGCGRLATLDDAEALHDFRVALRRLRSVLRSFRSELGDAVPKKLQRQLRDVTRATGAARDAEVQLGWVRSHRAELGRRLPPGLPWLLARLAQQQDEAYADIRRTAAPARPHARVAEAASDAARRAARPARPRGGARSRGCRSRRRAGAPSPCGRAAGVPVSAACSRPATRPPAGQRRAARPGPTRRPNAG